MRLKQFLSTTPVATMLFFTLLAFPSAVEAGGSNDVVSRLSVVDDPNFPLIYEDLPNELRYSSADQRTHLQRLNEGLDRILERSDQRDLREQLRENRLIPSSEQVDAVFESGIITRLVSGPAPSDYAFKMTQMLLGSPATMALSNLRDDVPPPETDFRTGITYMVHLMCYIAIVFCSFYMGYIFIAGLIKSTKDGEFMGDWDTTFIMVRTGIGTLGVIPLSRYGGLCLAQVIVLTAFLMGIGAGSTILSLMARELMTTPIVAATVPKEHIHGLAQNIIDMQICGLVQHELSQTLPSPINATLARTEYESYRGNLTSRIDRIVTKDFNVGMVFNVRDPGTCGAIRGKFPAQAMSTNSDGDPTINYEERRSGSLSNIFSFNSDPQLSTYLSSTYIQNHFEHAIGLELLSEQGAVANLWYDLQPLTKLAVARNDYALEHAYLSGYDVDTRKLTIPDVRDVAPMLYWHAIDRYQAAVNAAVVEAANAPAMVEIADKLYDIVDTHGMMFGGSYYYLMVRHQNAIAQAVENSTPAHDSVRMDRLMRSGWYGDLYRGLMKVLRRVQQNETDYLIDARAIMDVIMEGSHDTASIDSPSEALIDYNTVTSGDTSLEQAMAAVSLAIADGLKSIPRIGEQTSRANPDPLLEIQSLGNKIQQATALSVVVKGVTGLKGGPLRSEEEGSTEAGFVSVLLANIVTAIILTLVSISILYASVIPMLPYVMFTISVLGLFTYLLKALIAAPLWWGQHMHPKGEDLVGSASAGWKLMAGLYLRPALMVMGLIGAMALIRLTGAFVNESMGVTVFLMQDGFTGFSLVTHLLMYGIVMLVLTYKTFSLIYELQQTVLGWIGVGDSYTDFGEKEAQFKVVGLGALAGNEAKGVVANSPKN